MATLGNVPTEVNAVVNETVNVAAETVDKAVAVTNVVQAELVKLQVGIAALKAHTEANVAGSLVSAIISQLESAYANLLAAAKTT